MAKKKAKTKAKKEMAEPKFVFPFYTEERWNNWIEQVKNSGFVLKEDEDPGNSGQIFVYMEDDVILACLKVIAKYENKELSADDALDAIDDIKQIMLKPINPISEAIDLMIDSLQTSMIAVFAATEYYIDGVYDKSDDLKWLVKEALAAEEANDPGSALGYIASLGASILAGAELSEDMLSELPYGLVAEWMDGIDSIAAAMLGDDSYKFDELDDDE